MTNNQVQSWILATKHISFLLLYIATIPSQGEANVIYNIGAVLSSKALEDSFKNAVFKVNTDHENYGLGDARINASTIILDSNPLQATIDICNALIPNKLFAMVTSRANNSTEAPTIVSYACGFYNIPVIGTEARDCELSDKNLHPNFLRVVPAFSDEVRVLVGLLTYFKWNKVNLVTSDDYDGRFTFSKFTSLAYQKNINIEHPVMFPAGSDNLRDHLKVLKDSQSKVIIFSSNSRDAAVAFKSAVDLDIVGDGYIWITTETATSGEAKAGTPQGFLTIRLDMGRDIGSQVHDAVKVIAIAIGKVHNRDLKLTDPPSSCDELSDQWKSGEDLYRVLINTTHTNGITGKVQFDWSGDRTFPDYSILNVKIDPGTSEKIFERIGKFSDTGNIDMNLSQLVWPGNRTEIPKGIFVSNHLRIVTVESKPFVIAKPLPKSGSCSDLDETVNGKSHHYIPCDGETVTLPGKKHCCKGFCIDLLTRLAKRVNFTYELYLVADGQFGSLTRVNGTNIKRWNGLVADIVEGKADLIIASLTISNERAQYIEFSKPFKYQGITILVKKNESKSNLDSFLRPFRTELWLLVLLSVHVVALILYLLDRFSPFGRYKLAQADKEETALDLSSAMWFSWGVLLNSGIGEVTPRSFSARVLAMVWAGFAMIIVASYTANLAAFLVLDRPKPVVTGIDDPNMRNPTESFKYGTVANTSVDAYFRRQVELSSMYTFMEKYNVKAENEGIDAVKSGSLKAFIWDSPVLYHEASQDCSVTTVGELFGRSGYGIGMPKGSSWSHEISLAILNFHESGVMEELESTWIDFGNCPKDTSSSTTLGLNHMLGVFIMVAVGIGAGIVIVVLEVLYYKHKGWRKEQQELVKKATEQWQEKVADKKREKENIVEQNGIRMTAANGYITQNVNPAFEGDYISRPGGIE